MKWFKHLIESGDDPDIGAIENEFGFKGYYLFFRTLEIMSKEFSVKNPGEKSFNFQWFLGRFSRRIDKKTLLNFLDFTTNLGRIYYEMNGKNINLKCPKLKELTDDYTARVLRSESEVDTKLKESKLEKNPSHRNKNKEVRNKNKENIYSPKFLQFWFFYPRKKEKIDAYDKWKRLTRKQQEEATIGAKNYDHDCKNKNTEQEFIKSPARFLNKNKEYWKDYLKEPEKLDGWAEREAERLKKQGEKNE